MSEKNKGILHGGHRERLREKISKNGFDLLEKHEALECLLFSPIKRTNTNEHAHELIRSFENVRGVFEADFKDLIKIEGIGPSSAIYIKAMQEISQRYLKKRVREFINSSELGSAYAVSKFKNSTEQKFFVILLDNKSAYINDIEIKSSNEEISKADLKQILECCLRNNVASVFLTHNHLIGAPGATELDKLNTRIIYNALARVYIPLSDHIIVVGDSFISMAESGDLDLIRNS